MTNVSKPIFELNGHDPFLDYVKGVCVFFVILAVILFSFWGDQAVPCFLLIQVFHAYKKGIYKNTGINFQKVFNRILLPFLFVTLLSFFLLYIISDINAIQLLKSGLADGGYGPGSYYVWIYFQFLFLIPLCRYIFIRLSGYKLMLFFILLSVLTELICSYTHPPLPIYRLLFFRYLFLIYLGYMLTIKGIRFTVKLHVLNILSLIFIFLFQYTNYDFEPYFYNSDWKIFHWIIYFYTVSAFLYLLNITYCWTPIKMSSLFKLMGRYSYEIFLSQMLVFTFFKSEYLYFFKEQHISVGVMYICLTITLSILPILLYGYFKKNVKYDV